MMTMTMMIQMETKIKPSVALIITAAGSSTRMGCGCKKEYLLMGNGSNTVLSAASEPFFKALTISTVIITIPENSTNEEIKDAKTAFFTSNFIKNIFENKDTSIIPPELLFVKGGSSRQESVLKGLLALEKAKPEIVLIHDGARPFVTEKIIQNVYNAVLTHEAATCGITPVDTQKEIDSTGKIVRHLNRAMLSAVQTPQGFKYNELLKAHKIAIHDNKLYTDDTEIWNEYISLVYVVEGSSKNKKITFPEDLNINI